MSTPTRDDVVHWWTGSFQTADPVTGDVRWKWDCETGTWGEPVPPTGDYWWMSDCAGPEPPEPEPGPSNGYMSAMATDAAGLSMPPQNQGTLASGGSSGISVQLTTTPEYDIGGQAGTQLPVAALPAGTVSLIATVNVPGVPELDVWIGGALVVEASWMTGLDNGYELIYASSVNPLVFTHTGKDAGGNVLWTQSVSFTRL